MLSYLQPVARDLGLAALHITLRCPQLPRHGCSRNPELPQPALRRAAIIRLSSIKILTNFQMLVKIILQLTQPVRGELQ